MLTYCGCSAAPDKTDGESGTEKINAAVFDRLEKIILANRDFSKNEAGLKSRPPYRGYAKSIEHLKIDDPKHSGNDYSWHYEILKEHRDKSGLTVIDSYFICVWPAKKGFGNKVYIAGSRGIYSRDAVDSDEYEYPLSGWPEAEDLKNPGKWVREM